MSVLGYILLFTFIGSILSLAGGVLLLFHQKRIKKISHLLSSFAAGALLGTAFFDLLPEALEEWENSDQVGHVIGAAEYPINDVFVWALIGVLFFFLLERFIYWFHHHHETEEAIKPTVPLIVLGDSIHNFIDGVAIAAAFMVDIPLGIVTALAVGAHEIPQEIGDFGILLGKGLRRRKVLLINLFSAMASLVGAVLTFFLSDLTSGLLPVFLALTAGFFIYIALSDLVPEIHEENRRGFALVETIALLVGVAAIWMVLSLLEGVH